ncbi:hypothetical protein [Nocardioides sp.]|uniref:hypothetical protein n=1 Tax=Nocardioides sp. TaxID=35761 RepID=UPI002C15AC20|nr:hypothetical protein [Nocardioides sp.]HXH77285.1 hypothetical protein [Nocardioides sp.]
MNPETHPNLTGNTYRIVESPPRASHAAVGQVASVGRSPASVHVILTADAARVLAKALGLAAIAAERQPLRGFDPQLWSGIALDLEASSELGDLDASTGPDDVAFAPLLRLPDRADHPRPGRHRGDAPDPDANGWSQSFMEYQPTHSHPYSEAAELEGDR